MQTENREKKSVKVSVVVPVYNVQDYLEKCLDSILAQTLSDIEVICVDDGSTDRSGEILEKYRKKDSRVSVYHQQNLYAGCARNLGLSHAVGKYVVFWDSDDFFREDALEKLYRRCEEDQAQIGVCGAYFYDAERDYTWKQEALLIRRMLPEKRPFTKADIGKYLFTFGSNVPWNKMFLRSFIKERQLAFQPLRRANDAWFVMMALFYASRITAVEDYLIYYRTENSSSLTGQAAKTRYCTMDAFRAVAEELRKQGDDYSPALEQSFVNKVAQTLIDNLNKMQDPDVFREMFEAYRTQAFPALGISAHISGLDYSAQAAYFYDPVLLERVRSVVEGDPAAYLLQRSEQLRQQVIKNGKVMSDYYKQVRQLENRVHLLETSTAYKVGRAVTWVPRKLKDMAGAARKQGQEKNRNE